MPILVQEEIDFPIDQVWRIVGDFAGLMRWHPDVRSCVLKGSGIGSERVVTLGDRFAHERLDALDPARHVLQYTVTAGSDPRSVGVTGRIELTPLPAGRTRIVWTSGLPDHRPDAAAVNARLQAYYPTRIGHLRAALARLSPA